MARNDRSSRVLLIGVSAILVLASAPLVLAEAMPFFDSGVTPAQKFTALVDRNLRPGPSIASQRLVLDDCFVAINSVFGRAAPSARRAALLLQCATVSQTVVAHNDANALAWAISALVAAERGNRSEFSDALVQSQKRSPAEGWLAQLRLKLVDRYPELSTADVLGASDADVATAVRTGAGLRLVAEQYSRRVASREHVSAVIETLPASIQAQFVASVREVASAGL